MQSKFEAWILWRWGCHKACVEVWCDRNSKLGFRILDARWMRQSRRGGLMWSKFEAWIPNLGCKEDATKQTWRFDVIEIQSLYSEAWMRGGCDKAGVEVWCDRNSKLRFRSLDSVEVDV